MKTVNVTNLIRQRTLLGCHFRQEEPETPLVADSSAEKASGGPVGEPTSGIVATVTKIKGDDTSITIKSPGSITDKSIPERLLQLTTELNGILRVHQRGRYGFALIEVPERSTDEPAFASIVYGDLIFAEQDSVYEEESDCFDKRISALYPGRISNHFTFLGAPIDEILRWISPLETALPTSLEIGQLLLNGRVVEAKNAHRLLLNQYQETQVRNTKQGAALQEALEELKDSKEELATIYTFKTYKQEMATILENSIPVLTQCGYLLDPPPVRCRETFFTREYNKLVAASKEFYNSIYDGITYRRKEGRSDLERLLYSKEDFPDDPEKYFTFQKDHKAIGPLQYPCFTQMEFCALAIKNVLFKNKEQASQNEEHLRNYISCPNALQTHPFRTLLNTTKMRTRRVQVFLIHLKYGLAISYDPDLLKRVTKVTQKEIDDLLWLPSLRLINNLEKEYKHK
ncbi:MAG: hypothetical protein HYY52_03260 [Candidatus Melainabacteria bacterium]|nr:hypothetical protein [Candidatus Melainabacteria bacterium]